VGADDILETGAAGHIVACGTSYHAGLVARYQMEELAGIPCMVEVASEYRYRNPVVPEHTLFVVISQSGETADTLAALRHAKESGYLATLAICNVPESSIVREAGLVLMTRAGLEIGVASTKAFTTQLVALQLLVLELAQLGGRVGREQLAAWIRELNQLPERIEQALLLDARIEKLAEHFVEKRHALFLGRGSHYPIAMEGALKLKEIFIHAEAYPPASSSTALWVDHDSRWSPWRTTVCSKADQQHRRGPGPRRGDVSSLPTQALSSFRTPAW
jgi:glucosamine--fructose-6-phosphate aminotransferase (isomerizing)